MQKNWSRARTQNTLTANAEALTPLEDAAEFNATFDWESTTGLPRYIVNMVNGPLVRDNPVLPQGPNSPGTVRWQIDAGWSQDVSDVSGAYPNGVITYGFFNHMHALGLNNSPWYGEGKGYSPFTAAQKAAARIAVQTWDDLIAPEFVEVAPSRGARDWAQKTVDIWLANTTTGPAQAWAYYPGYGKPNDRVAGDVWIADPRINGTNGQLDPGFYGVQTLNHELGHSIGLSHPGTYDFGDDLDGDGQPDPITYTGDAQYFQDSNQFSIMSYFDSYETGAQNIDWNLMRFVYPSTPMVDDVFVAQQKYGAEMNTRTGNTTYGFGATADVTNEAMKFKANEMFTIFTIWDANGEDTLNLSGYYTPSVIDLREGAYSSAGGVGAYDPAELSKKLSLAEINANNADAGLGARTARLYEIYHNGNWSDTNADGTKTLVNEGLSWKEITGTGDQYLMEQNIGIAYGAIIENAIGGHGADRINGNQANNKFTGGAGADTFIISDYSGVLPRPNGPAVTIDDESVDTIMDFKSGVDRIDLSTLRDANGQKLDYADLSVVGNTWTVERGDDDLSFIVLGDTAQPGDFYFG